MLKENKTDQIQIRIAPSQKKIAKAHAALRGETLCEFLMRMIEIDKELMSKGQ